MRTTFQIAFGAFIISLSLPVAAAMEGIILNPRETSITQRILSYKNYDDIRVDGDLDGYIDEWYVRKGDIQIHLSYKNRKIHGLEITKFTGGNIAVKRFQSISGKLVLTRNESRPIKVMHGSANDVCEEAKTLLDNTISTLTQDLSAIGVKTELSSVPQSCKIDKFPEFAENLGSMGDILRADSDKITNCLEKSGSIEGIKLNVVSAKFKLVLNKIADGNFKDTYSCEMTKNKVVSGEATEDGRIKFLIPSGATDPIIQPEAMAPLFYHEVLHVSGIKSEDAIKEILDSCSKGKPLKSGANHIFIPSEENVALSSDKVDSQTANTKKEVASVKKESSRNQARGIASSAVNSGDGIDIKSEIANAEKVIPSAEKLAATSTDKSPAGKEQALRSSVAESAPVFKMANQVMGASNTPAIADTSDSSDSRSSSSSYSSSPSVSTYSPSSSSSSEVGSSGSSRDSSGKSTGQRYQSRHGRYQSKGVGSDEYVAEEIDLTKNVDAQATRNRDNRRQAAARASQSDTQTYQPATLAAGSASRGPASASDEVAKGKKSPTAAGGADSTSSVGGATGSGSLNLDTGSSGGGGGGSTASNNRNQKSRSASSSRAPASASQGSPAQRRELMDNLRDDNYVLMKRKLREQSYQDELSANGITVMDTYGGRWGASQGTVIYLDNGDRFIRQR